MTITIYQINRDRDSKGNMFASYRASEKRGINMSSYDKVFEGDVPCKDLEDVFEMFNIALPYNYYGRSMSVSDIVQVEGDGTYYCDILGFKRIGD